VATLSKYNSSPSLEHWEALKQLLKYLRFTHSQGLVLDGPAALKFTAYVDSGFKRDPDTSRSAGGYCFLLGNSLISHKSQWSTSIFPSSCETEIAALFMATSTAAGNLKYVKPLVSSLNLFYYEKILMVL
jgi:hypothetical protein